MTTPKDGAAACALSAGVLLATAALYCSCTPDGPSVAATAQLIDRSDAAAAVGLQWADGTYGSGCMSRSGSWSLRFAGDASMDFSALSVLADNTSCALTLTSLTGSQANTATPPIVLGTSYAFSTSAFGSGDGGATRFYGYGSLSSPDFSNDFVVTVLLTDTPGTAADGGGGDAADGAAIDEGDAADGGADGGADDAVEGGADGAADSTVNGGADGAADDGMAGPDGGGDSGGPITVTASATAWGVSSPDYKLDLTTGALALALDHQNVVRSVAGYAVLKDGAFTGNDYFVDQGHLPANPTFAQLDSAYAANVPTAIAGANPQIPAASFGLAGANLTSPLVRTIVVRRVVAGVPSYESLQITFRHS